MDKTNEYIEMMKILSITEEWDGKFASFLRFNSYNKFSI